MIPRILKIPKPHMVVGIVQVRFRFGALEGDVLPLTRRQSRTKVVDLRSGVATIQRIITTSVRFSFGSVKIEGDGCGSAAGRLGLGDGANRDGMEVLT